MAQLLPLPLPLLPGANIGLFALRLLLDPATAPAVERVHAFEPLPPTAAVLAANLRAHGVADKVRGLPGRARVSACGWPYGCTAHQQAGGRAGAQPGGKNAGGCPGHRAPATDCPPQVTVHRCGLHSAPGPLPFTFYPAMPGNSTARPDEKWAGQRLAMAARMGAAAADARFAGAAAVQCPVTTLAQVVREQGLPRIDLLKVGG